jgi:hypothetical protein
MICYKRKCFDCEIVNVAFFSNFDGKTRCEHCANKKMSKYMKKTRSTSTVRGKYSMC